MFADFTLSLPHSVDKVYAALLDLESVPRWQPGVESIRVEPPGPVQVGTRVVEKRTLFGRPIESTGEFTRLTPNKSIEIESPPDAPGPLFRSEYKLIPDGKGTLLHFSINYELNGFLRLMEPFVLRAARKDMTERFARFARHLDDASS